MDYEKKIKEQDRKIKALDESVARLRKAVKILADHIQQFFQKDKKE